MRQNRFPLPAAAGESEVFISPACPSWRELAGEIWRYRALLVTLVGRDLRARHAQTAFGTFGYLLQPFLTSGVLAVVLHQLSAGAAHGGFLFLLAGLVPWTTFAASITKAAGSVEQNAGLVRRFYFPRLLLPLANVAASAVNYAILFTGVVLACALAGMPWYRLAALAPALLAIQLCTAAGIAAAASAVGARFRDAAAIFTFALGLGMFVTVLVPLRSWPPLLQSLLLLSPMTVVVDLYRTALYGEAMAWSLLAWGGLVAGAVLVAGLEFFRRREPLLLDLI